MTKIYGFIFFFTIIILSLTACQATEQEVITETDVIENNLNDKARKQTLPDSKEGITFEVETKKHTNSPSVVTILMRNNSDHPISYGRQFSVEKNVDDIWYVVPFEDDPKFFQDDAPAVGAQETISEKIDLTQLKENLSPGNYRVTRTFGNILTSDKSTADTEYEDFALAAPFEITN